MEPTPQDVQAVAAAIGQPAAPEAQPAPQQQPAAVTPQPTPSQQPAAPAAPADPFTQFFPSEPAAPAAAPVEPAAPQAQPAQPAPAAQPEAQPAPVAPAAAPAPVAEPAPEPTMTYEQYIDSVLQGVPTAPDMPDPAQVDPNSEEGVTQFFTDLMTAAEQRFEAKFARNQAIQTAERKLWDAAFEKYGSLRTNDELRGMVHAIRMQEFNNGRAITPTQAAEKLLGAFNQQYRQGVADNQVVTTIEQTQPLGGNGTEVPTTTDADAVLRSVQTGGEQALMSVLDQRIKNGTL